MTYHIFVFSTLLYFDMGSICAHVKEVSKTELKCEIQNEGWIYENQTIVFGSKFKKDKTRFGKQTSNASSLTPITSNEKTTPYQTTSVIKAEIENENKFFADKIDTPENVENTEDSDEDIDDIFMRQDVQFILQNDIDYVIQSVYKSHQELADFKAIIKQEEQKLGAKATNKHVRIMAKLENEDAINDLNKLLEVADAIMVPRGQLGILLPIEKISWIQKNIVKLCNYRAKPVILASQFLDSMVFNPFPSRAEVSDIHAAVIDGSDGLLLNAEISVGKYPL